MGGKLRFGVDPGKGGAVVALADGRITFCKNAGTEHDTARFILGLMEANWGCDAFAMIERVSAHPKEGVHSVFEFGRSYGFLRGCLVAAGVPFEEVTPAVWQRAVGILKVGGESGTEKKNRHKACAQQLFPGITVTHATADALLIAEYCRRKWG